MTDESITPCGVAVLPPPNVHQPPRRPALTARAQRRAFWAGAGNTLTGWFSLWWMAHVLRPGSEAAAARIIPANERQE